MRRPWHAQLGVPQGEWWLSEPETPAVGVAVPSVTSAEFPADQRQLRAVGEVYGAVRAVEGGRGTAEDRRLLGVRAQVGGGRVGIAARREPVLGETGEAERPA
ncbi:hypothetical protein RKD49_006606 [Streptomyces glaucescens]